MKSCPTITYQIKDEAKATKEYRALSKKLRKAGRTKEARIVKGISKDENRHRKVLSRISRKIC